MKDITLITITKVVDDETGIWRQGEIEFGIFTGLLEDYLKSYGEKGKKEIIDTLEYLKSRVEKCFDGVA